jgi:hypothetical protein
LAPLIFLNFPKLYKDSDRQPQPQSQVLMC